VVEYVPPSAGTTTGRGDIPSRDSVAFETFRRVVRDTGVRSGVYAVGRRDVPFEAASSEYATEDISPLSSYAGA